MPIHPKRRKASNALKSHYDVVVLGAGPAGLAAAIRLRQLNKISVLVADAKDLSQRRIGEACPPDIIYPLNQLGLVTQFRQAGHATCPGFASSWGRQSVGYNDFIVSPLGPGWRLDRHAFDNMLAKAAEDNGVGLAWHTRFQKAERAASGFRLYFAVPNGDRTITHASFVIDATGPEARFATAMGAAKPLDDRLLARIMLARVPYGAVPSRRVMLESFKDGWWYAAALPNDHLVTMLVAKERMIRRIGFTRGFRLAALETCFVATALAGVPMTDVKYRTVPIRPGLLSQLYGSGWVAVGDAAASYDPIMAQGIHKALSGGVAAARAITNSTQWRYADGIRSAFATYRKLRAHAYGLEQRWTESEFWTERAALAVV